MEIDEVRPWPAGAWQRLLAAVLTRSDELTELAGGPPAAGGGPSAAAAERQFGVRVPRGFAKRIRLSDRATFRQVLPAAADTKRWTGS
jgi:L-lysine 2,3-aminomutase